MNITPRLVVDDLLQAFVEKELLPGTDVGPQAFWSSLEAILADFTPTNVGLLRRRDELQERIDARWKARRGQAFDGLFTVAIHGLADAVVSQQLGGAQNGAGIGHHLLGQTPGRLQRVQISAADQSQPRCRILPAKAFIGHQRTLGGIIKRQQADFRHDGQGQRNLRQSQHTQHFVADALARQMGQMADSGRTGGEPVRVQPLLAVP